LNSNNINKMEMPDFARIYPDVFYKIQPYIMMICDQMDSYYGDTPPSQEMLDQISENIANMLMEMYPDLQEYAREYEQRADADQTVSEVITRSPFFRGRRFRRRGLFRDLIDILFFSEFFRRRRRPWIWF